MNEHFGGERADEELGRNEVGDGLFFVKPHEEQAFVEIFHKLKSQRELEGSGLIHETLQELEKHGVDLKNYDGPEGFRTSFFFTPLSNRLVGIRGIFLRTPYVFFEFDEGQPEDFYLFTSEGWVMLQYPPEELRPTDLSASE